MTNLEQLLQRLGKEEMTFTVELNNIKYDCHKLPFAQLLKIDEEHECDTELGAFERNQEVIFSSCDMFKKALDSVEHHGEPYKIVGKLLQPLEVYAFYGEILSHYMGQKNKDIETVKKP